MHERRQRIWIGLFVLLALVLLAALVLLFGSLPSMFRQTNDYTIRFTDAPGVTPGAPVRRSGVRVGEVTDVVLDESGDVKVKVALDKKYKVRRNEEPTLVSGLIGPDTHIEFVPRKQEKGQPPLDTSEVQPGSELVGVVMVGVGALVNRAAEVVPTTQETLKKIGDSMEKIQKSVDQLTPIAEDALKEYRSLAQDARKEIPNLRRTNDDLDKLIRSTNDALPRLEKNLTGNADELGAAARTYNKLGERLNVLLEGNQDKLVKIVDNLNETLTRAANLLNEDNQRNVNRTLRNVANASENLDPLSRNANELMRDGRQTLKRMDDVLINLQQTTKPLAESSGRIVRNADETLDRLNKTTADLRGLIQAVGSSNGTLYRVLQDPSLYNRLDEAACQVNKMLPRLERILKDFETFADKVARHPESLGVRGAIQPGSGLKDPPATGYTPKP
jgi:phospholipid/cholesterol/gamma-HCH transport system substrate-binding protein